MNAIFTGSFDPVTLGHEDLIRRGAAMFSHLTVAVCINSSKAGLFSQDQRLLLLKEACRELENVEIVCIDGLLADYCKQNNIRFIIRGIRSSSDLDYEISLSRINQAIYPELETVFLPASPVLSHISSSVVREMLRYHHSIAPFVSPTIDKKIAEFLSQNA